MVGIPERLCSSSDRTCPYGVPMVTLIARVMRVDMLVTMVSMMVC